MAYTTIDNPELYFQTKLYTGNGGTNALTLDGSENMQPDLVWIKNRNGTQDHHLFDSVRGTLKRLESNSNTNEETRASSLTSYDSDGFTLGTYANTNTSSDTYVAWNWKAGGSASSNSNGSITSSVSASTTAGFSIVSYTGNLSTATVGHGLGVAPAMIIIKARTFVEDWIVYHQSTGNTVKLDLNTTNATNASVNYWQNTTPSSSVFYIGANDRLNKSGENYIAYCFAEKKGYSKFGKFTGNGSTDGAFIYTGFKPAFWLQKRIDGSGGWVMYDNKRAGYNPKTDILYANDSAVEDTSNSVWADIVSNGFKYRTVGGNDINNSGNEYIYMAFAENPFVTSTGIPTTAR